MKAALALAVALAAGASIGGCAFVPKHSAGLDEASAAYDRAMADDRVASLAQPELREALDLLERARAARNTLDDIAEVDHLAYLAKQRVAIGREAAVLRELARNGAGP